jgi:hypothetical protein
MPLDTGLLYGEMIGSGVAHFAIAIGIGTLFSYLPYMPLSTKRLALIAAIVAISFAFQFGFLTFLQASSCDGVKDYGHILYGSLVAAAITAVMVAVPVFVEPLRLAISQVFVKHERLLSERERVLDTKLVGIVKETGAAAAAATADDSAAVVQTGGALSPTDYEVQTFREMMFGTAYWGAFAGAYGIGLGSLQAAKCRATK